MTLLCWQTSFGFIGIPEKEVHRIPEDVREELLSFAGGKIDRDIEKELLHSLPRELYQEALERGCFMERAMRFFKAKETKEAKSL